MTAMNNPGDCFEACWRAATTTLNDIDDYTEVLIVHALPIGTGPLNLGKRYWHAWCEVKTSGGWMVLDWHTGAVSAGKAIKRAMFYRIARVDQRLIWRYTIDEAIAQMREHLTWGPWIPDWQTYEDPAITTKEATS